MHDGEPLPLLPKPMRVLILGGWSPGPLDHLRGHFREFEFEEPPIPMPPSGCMWCMNPFCILLVAYVCAGIPWLFTIAASLDNPGSAIMYVSVVLGSLVVVRLFVAALVRFSVYHGARIAMGAIERTDPDMLIGFSWGGAVAWELCASHRWTGPTVLLAPTVSAICGITFSSPPKLRVPACSEVHVFHAREDPFCPDAQHSYLQEDGCVMHLHTDNHMLCGRHTVSDIIQTITQFKADTIINAAT